VSRRLKFAFALAGVIAGMMFGPAHAGADPGCFLTTLNPVTVTDNVTIVAGKVATGPCSHPYHIAIQIETNANPSGTYQPYLFCNDPSLCTFDKPNTGSYASGTTHTACATSNCVFHIQDRIACGAHWKELVTIFRDDTQPHPTPIFAQESGVTFGCV
jgi:hypothetical protein